MPNSLSISVLWGLVSSKNYISNTTYDIFVLNITILYHHGHTLDHQSFF